MFKDWGDCVRNGVATLNCVPAVFLNVVNGLLIFSGLFALLLFIMGGFKYMNSAGDPKNLEGARNNLIYGTVGLLVVLFSFLIINIVSQVTGVKCINFGQFGFGCQ